MAVAIKFLHLLSIVIWVGSVIFFSLIAAPAIFRAVDRKTAGDVVALIFPQYYLLGYVCAAVSILTLAWLAARAGWGFHAKAGLAALILMGALTVVSGVFVAPKVNKVKYEMRAETDSAKLETMRAAFGKWHGVSMALNAGALLAGLALVYFASRYLGDR